VVQFELILLKDNPPVRQLTNQGMLVLEQHPNWVMLQSDCYRIATGHNFTGQTVDFKPSEFLVL
jgi:hypothetical protein